MHLAFIVSISATEEQCPYGEQSQLPDDEELFTITSPEGTNPEDVLPGGSGVPLDVNENIMITMAEEPDEFYLMDLRYTATGPTTVILETSDGNTVTENVS